VKKNVLALSAMVMLALPLFSQQEANFAVIRPGESFPEIVRKAANVTPSPGQLEWQKLEFIAFAHFGINTFMDQEWGKGTESPSAFNPTDFDARQWAKVIKDAGMKLLIITAKHHDGFCLWRSKFTTHSVKSSPWKNGKGDVVDEVARACKEAGLKFGVYLSPWDRHEPSFGDSPRYNEHFRNQLRELLTNYGEISEVWFDGANAEGPNGKKQVYDWPSYYKVIRELAPNAVIAIMGPDVRWVGTESGYGRETEWSVLPNITQNLDAIAAASQQFPVDGAFVPRDLMDDDLGSRKKIQNASALVWYPAETDVSIRPGWFYHASQDNLVKTPAKLVDIYYSSVGRNSVLLLNIPPDRRGRITEFDVKSLQGMRTILDQTYRTNLAAGATVVASGEKSGHKASAIISQQPTGYWTTEDGVESASIEFQFPEERIFDRLMLQENLRVGQRIESFRLETWSNDAWITIARGTTVGYKRLLRFPAVTSQRVRLAIDSSRTSPTLSRFGLFKSPPTVTIEPDGGSFEISLSVRLSSDSKHTAIFYTLDGTEPTTRSPRYNGPIKLTRSARLRAVASVAGHLAAELSEALFTKCLKIREMVFEKPYNSKYPGHGDATIINGRRGSLDFQDKEWLGFNGDDVIASLDLGASKPIHSITAGFLQQQGSWIFLPTEVRFLVSQDGTSWKEVGHQINEVQQSESVLSKDFTCTLKGVSAKFLKIVAKNVGTCPPWHAGSGDKTWLFVDEVSVE
jgi:alpha-L-fucosidase